MKYTYMQITVSYYNIAEKCNQWVGKGWEVFTVLSSSNTSGMGDCVILLRKKDDLET